MSTGTLDRVTTTTPPIFTAYKSVSTVTLDQPMTSPVIHGSIPDFLPLLKPDSNLSLLINLPGVHYRLEAPIVGSLSIEDNRIVARFIVDANVYLDLNLMGQSVELDNKFKRGHCTLFYKIEEQRPRAH